MGLGTNSYRVISAGPGLARDSGSGSGRSSGEGRWGFPLPGVLLPGQREQSVAPRFSSSASVMRSILALSSSGILLKREQASSGCLLEAMQLVLALPLDSEDPACDEQETWRPNARSTPVMVEA